MSGMRSSFFADAYEHRAEKKARVYAAGGGGKTKVPRDFSGTFVRSALHGVPEHPFFVWFASVFSITVQLPHKKAAQKKNQEEEKK